MRIQFFGEPFASFGKSRSFASGYIGAEALLRGTGTKPTLRGHAQNACLVLQGFGALNKLVDNLIGAVE